jgi:ATP-dependent protease ClpP protease subunit
MSSQTWFTITNSSATEAIIDLEGVIGSYGISTEVFRSHLRALKGKSLVLNINSPGGSVEDGLNIYDDLREYPSRVSVNINGTAASMASVIVLAAEAPDRTITANGRVMIHRVTAGIHGNPDQLDAGAKVARQFEDRIVAIYVGRLAKSEQDIRDMMKTEIGTWFHGEQAVAAGFAHKVNTTAKTSAFKNEWAHLFTMLPAAIFDIAPPPSPSRTPTPMKALLALASLVGITVKGDETEDQLTAAITAHKPQSPNVVIDFEDTAVKAAFAKAITDATQADKAEITALKAELAKITALLTNGAAGAAGGNAPVKSVATAAGSSIQEQFAAITDPAERTRFYNNHRADLSKPSSYFKAA